MKIVGLDLGRETAAASYTADVHGKCVRLNRIDYTKMVQTPEHHQAIFKGMRGLIKGAHYLGFENVPFLSSTAQVQAFSTYRAHLLHAAVGMEIIQGVKANGDPTIGVYPATLKKFCCGTGKATKEQMMSYAETWVEERLSDDVLFFNELDEKDYDMADAVCVLAWSMWAMVNVGTEA